MSADEALDQLLRALDIPGERIPIALDARSALYRSVLHGRRMLILLDNAATAEQIRPLLPGSPTCRVLVTSRSQMSGLVAREGAKRLPLDVLSADRATELIRTIVGDGRTNADPAATAELTRFCGHLPLALRIAAERLATSPHLSVADLVGELAEERGRLDALTVDGDDSATVRVVFSWSYRTLPPDAARMFRLLSLPAGPDLSAAAAAVLFGTTETKARRLLDKLVESHLLNEHQSRRYRFHDLLRVYAAERAENEEPAEDRHSALECLFTWYAHCVSAAAKAFAPDFSRIPMILHEPHLKPPAFSDRLEALHWCDAEHENLVAAVRTAADIGKHALAWQLPVALFGFFLVRKPLADWVATHDTGLESARALGDRAAEVWLLTSSALAHRDLRQYETARRRLQQALPGWREIGQPWGEAWALRDLGQLDYLLGRIPEAQEALERALAMHIAEGDTWGEATASSALAMTYQNLGRTDEALRYLDRALTIRQEHDDQRNIARVLNDLGLVYDSLGSTGQAIQYLERALAIHISVDYWYGEAVAHERLGDILARTGQSASAAEHWLAAIELYDKLGDPHGKDLTHRLP